MKSRLKIFLLVLFILSATLVVVAIVVRTKSLDTRSSAGEQNTLDAFNVAPKLVTLPPQVAYVGEEYKYLVKIADADNTSEEIKISFVQSPVWLNLQDKIIYGTPDADYEKTTNKVILQIDDGTNKVEETFYIVVIAQNEK